MRIKVSGMTSVEQIQELGNIGIEFAGLDFYPKSPYYFKKHHLSAIDLRNARLKIHTIGSFSNQPKEDILRIIDQWRLEMVQLDGNETPHFCQQMSEYVTVIKTIRIEANALMQWELDQYKDACDLFLFDTIHNNDQARWDVLEKFNIPNPFFLGGNINENSIPEIKAFLQKPVAQKMFGLDINEGFELRTGVKDTTKIEGFMKGIANQ